MAISVGAGKGEAGRRRQQARVRGPGALKNEKKRIDEACVATGGAPRVRGREGGVSIRGA
jgi:hypothetical protein